MTKPVTLSESDYQCLQMGRSLMLVGMKRAASILNEQINFTQDQLHATDIELKHAASEANGAGVIKPSMQRTLELAQAGAVLEELPPELRQKRKYKKRATAIKGYWAKMTSEERSIEMARRKDVALAKKGVKPVKLVQPNHPRNENHPKHKQWLAKMRRANRRSWDALTPLARQQRIGAALAGRAAKTAKR